MAVRSRLHLALDNNTAVPTTAEHGIPSVLDGVRQTNERKDTCMTPLADMMNHDFEFTVGHLLKPSDL